MMTTGNKLRILGLALLLVGVGIPAGTTQAASPDKCPQCFVVADARDVVRDETTGTVVHSTSGACVRTRWMSASDVCAPPAPATPVREELSREQRTVYFAFNKASLTPGMKQRLNTLAATLKSEHDVKEARVVGYADRIGDSGYNEKLSKRRADAVLKYLSAHGIVNARRTETRWLGSSDSVTHCPADLKRPRLIECLQGDRRVEVEIEYLPEQQ